MMAMNIKTNSRKKQEFIISKENNFSGYKI
jgi:hypothetical protein